MATTERRVAYQGGNKRSHRDVADYEGVTWDPETCGGPDATSADDAQHPWTVLVEDGRVVGRYRAEDTHSAGAEATRITLGGEQMEVYEVDASECTPPKVGEHVDPVALGWVKVG